MDYKARPAKRTATIVGTAMGFAVGLGIVNFVLSPLEELANPAGYMRGFPLILYLIAVVITTALGSLCGFLVDRSATRRADAQQAELDKRGAEPDAWPPPPNNPE